MPTGSVLSRTSFLVLAVAAVLILTQVPTAVAFNQSAYTNNCPSAGQFSDGLCPLCVFTNTIGPIGDCVESTIPYWAIGIMLSFAMVGIAYMLGEVLNLSGLKNWYQGELWESTKTIMIVVIIFAALILLSGIGDALAGPYVPTGLPAASFSQVTGGTSISSVITNNLQGLYGADEAYLKNGTTYLNNAFGSLLGAAMGIDFLKSVTFSLWLPLPIFPPVIQVSVDEGSTGNIFYSSIIDSQFTSPSYSMLGAAARLVVVPTLIIMELQYGTVTTSHPNGLFFTIVMLGLGLFIPFGIVMRALPFLRGLGGTMLAIGIGLSIVYPTLLVAINLPVTDMVLGQAVFATSPQAQSPCSAGLLCFLIQPIQQAFSGISTTANSLVSFGSGFGSATGTVFGGFDIPSSVYPVANLVTTNILVALLQFILFIIDLIVGYTIIRDVAALMGGSVRLSLGRRMSLV